MVHHPHLTLYRKDGACSIAAHMLLHELNLPFTDMPLIEGPNRFYEPADGSGRQAWLKINPTGYVPALSVNGTIITELSAVLYYISSLAPERGMMGQNALETAKVLEWMSWLSVTMNEYGFAGFWRPSRMVGLNASPEAEDAVRAESKRTILKGLARIEAKVEGHDFSVGDHLTVVDFMLHTIWRWAAATPRPEGVKEQAELGFEADRYPRFREVVSSVEQLPSGRTTLSAEAIGPLF